ncbi:NAD-dependent succinate-semialdehyde dehydrogenase [Lichenihabitans psoromatis]|uniref:NAD-dependent succinate-semialdehyde dehydrogenase n=1 Tax=Lichenihabitans psoromatis TaxID=2528642 RepID=UPI001035AA85|nr:NAD-dependent succinate-semialdehyde dehydrogenase [Lichenihabitans psoromatis]
MSLAVKTPPASALSLNDPSLLIEKAYVAGEWISVEHKSFTVTDPFDGAVLATLPDLGVEDTRRAIDKAAEVRADWAKRPAKERANVLKRWFDLVIANADDLAAILTAEQGKPLTEAKGEVVSNAAYLEWFAEEAKRIDGEIIPGPNAGQRILVLKQPVGVCAAITPWNFPNGMITRKVGPALAAGCTMVLKPSELTPLSALALALLGERAGVPKGAFSVVTTTDAVAFGTEVCKNPTVAKITFTGSTNVGRWLMREGADTIKRLSLELGGNAPFIVFDDADLDAAADGALLSKFRNAGQTCVCANRIYVQEGVVEAFTQKLLDRVAKLKLGRGSEAGVSLGPLIDERAVVKMERHLADAVGKGARVLSGGKRSPLAPTMFEPTVVTGVTQDMIVTREETFAPLAPIIAFKDEADVIAMANASEFGLASYFYAKDMGRIFRTAEALQSGMVGVNTGAIANEVAPFGGVKQSGLGREGSHHGIDAYLELKYVALAGL